MQLDLLWRKFKGNQQFTGRVDNENSKNKMVTQQVFTRIVIITLVLSFVEVRNDPTSGGYSFSFPPPKLFGLRAKRSPRQGPPALLNPPLTLPEPERPRSVPKRLEEVEEAPFESARTVIPTYPQVKY